ncbi:hypothetical protein BDQ17DRAFT_521591 [Cyathus striatus]|nr:hypothetical protein BDQ17DRAFT_521591 [Cyathus striatus]
MTICPQHQLFSLLFAPGLRAEGSVETLLPGSLPYQQTDTCTTYPYFPFLGVFLPPYHLPFDVSNFHTTSSMCQDSHILLYPGNPKTSRIVLISCAEM